MGLFFWGEGGGGLSWGPASVKESSTGHTSRLNYLSSSQCGRLGGLFAGRVWVDELNQLLRVYFVFFLGGGRGVDTYLCIHVFPIRPSTPDHSDT